MKSHKYLLNGLVISSLFICGSCDKVSSSFEKVTSYLRTQFDAERAEGHTFSAVNNTRNQTAQNDYYQQDRGSSNKNSQLQVPNDDDPSDSAKRKPFYHKERIKEYFNKGGDLYFVRGNNVSLMPIKGRENAYLLTMNGIGNNAIVFKDGEHSDASSTDIEDFLDNWSQTKEPIGAFIIFRNNPRKIQKDVVTTLVVTEPRYDGKSQSAEFVVIPQDEIRTKFVGNNLGSCALFVKF